jgi:hypothetical protein
VRLCRGKRKLAHSIETYTASFVVVYCDRKTKKNVIFIVILKGKLLNFSIGEIHSTLINVSSALNILDILVRDIVYLCEDGIA